LRADKRNDANADLSYYVDDTESIPPNRADLMRAQIAAFARYQPKFYEGRVTVFRAPRHPLWCSYDDALGWHSLAREVEVRLIAGAHRNLLEEPHVQKLAHELRAALLYNGATSFEH
jgi:thioesterase domain-containing protein